MKKGIIVASFGTSYEKTRKLCIESIENRITKEYEDFVVLRAFTSQMIINKLKRRDNYVVDNPKEALEKMRNKGIEYIYIQPLHIIPGHEYEKLLKQTHEFTKENDYVNIQTGKPLLFDDSDYNKVVKGMGFAKERNEEAVVFMGHGTDHSSDSYYEKLENKFIEKGYRNIFIGTVEGNRTLEDIIPLLKERYIKRVRLMPFMLVAGDHAINDMASDEDSWKTKLSSQGFYVETVLNGLGEKKAIQDIYMEHLKRIVS